VIVDTVGMTTRRNLGRPEEARAYFGPLMSMASDTGVPFLLMTHLSRDAHALGRRIVGASRVVWKMTCPDPDGQPNRRKLWVDKSYSLKPPALGVTIGDDGCTFDDNPPDPGPSRAGRKPTRRSACLTWLVDHLTLRPVPIMQVAKAAKAAGFGMSVLYAASEELGVKQVMRQGKRFWSLPDAEDSPGPATEFVHEWPSSASEIPES
jgi:hypothetical protein